MLVKRQTSNVVVTALKQGCGTDVQQVAAGLTLFSTNLEVKMGKKVF